MVLRGGGTEKVFDEICSLFPNVAVDRMDRDAIEKPDEYRKILARVRDKTTNILVGTQMIAKGHDLPGVTLVGIIDCDVGLHFPDFRASERIFQLLTQASGRAGRGDKIGRVILQTRLPRHPSIMNTLNRDFKAFAKLELAARKSLNYPPFSRILRVIATSTDKELPILTLKKLLVALKKKGIGTNGRVSILGPAPAPLQRLKKRWRVHLLLKANQATDLIEALKVLQSVHIHTNKVRINFDLDPQDML